MNSFRKPLTIGEEIVDIEVDRNIVSEVMCKFNDYFADMFEIASQNKDKDKKADGIGLVAEALRKGYGEFYLKNELMNEQIGRFSLPLMIRKANPEMTVAQAHSKSQDIYNICLQNDGVNTLSGIIFNFVLEGFTSTDSEKPTIKIAIG